MSSYRTAASLIAFALASLVFQDSTAQQCTDACASDRCGAQASCEMEYQTCFANAGGDPQLEALCEQQRSECLADADRTFLACLLSCPTNEPCTADAWYMNGYELSECNYGRYICLGEYPPEVCDAQYEMCVAAAQDRLESRLLSRCATTCVVSVEEKTWGMVKSLYRD